MAFINSWVLASDRFKSFPPNYPDPSSSTILFYIQRNVNKNTVVYELNYEDEEKLVSGQPLDVYWIMYENENKKKKLNFLQKKLAYGYNVIGNNGSGIEIQLVSYKNRKIYIRKNKNGDFKAYMLINGTTAALNNIFVFANESGAFPSVEYIELFGQDEATDRVVYERISV